MKKIVIDARFYGHENAGLGRYTMNFLNELMSQDRDNEYHILLRKAYFQKLQLPSNFHQVLVDARHYSFYEQILIPLTILRIKPHLTHFLHFNVPLLTPGRYIVTVHDLIMHHANSPESTTLSFLPFMLKRAMYYLTFHRSVYGAKHIFVPSETVKSQLLSNYRINKEKIQVMYEGIDKKIAYTKGQSFLKRNRINSPYFLYVGNAYPHKNLNIAVDALLRLNESNKKKVSFVIVCPRGIFYERLETLITQKNANAFVKLFGKVSDSDLSQLMSHASAFIYPSLLEGFGLPALEAMSVGTPAIVSDIPVFHEIYKDAAIFFDPKDSISLTNQMKKLLSLSTAHRAKISQNIMTFAKKYSWKTMTSKMLEQYLLIH